MKGGTLRNRGLEKYQCGQDVFNGSTSSECTITMANFSKMGGGQMSFEWCHVRLYMGRLHLGCNPGSRQQTDQHHPDISRQDTFDILGTRLVKNTAFDAFYKNDMLIHNTDPIWGIYHFRPFFLRSVQGGIASTNENQTGRKQNSLSLKPVSPTPVA